MPLVQDHLTKGLVLAPLQEKPVGVLAGAVAPRLGPLGEHRLRHFGAVAGPPASHEQPAPDGEVHLVGPAFGVLPQLLQHLGGHCVRLRAAAAHLTGLGRRAAAAATGLSRQHAEGPAGRSRQTAATGRSRTGRSRCARTGRGRHRKCQVPAGRGRAATPGPSRHAPSPTGLATALGRHGRRPQSAPSLATMHAPNPAGLGRLDAPVPAGLGRVGTGRGHDVESTAGLGLRPTTGRSRGWHQWRVVRRRRARRGPRGKDICTAHHDEWGGRSAAHRGDCAGRSRFRAGRGRFRAGRGRDRTGRNRSTGRGRVAAVDAHVHALANDFRGHREEAESRKSRSTVAPRCAGGKLELSVAAAWARGCTYACAHVMLASDIVHAYCI